MTERAKVRTTRRMFARRWLLTVPFVLLPTVALANVPFFFVFAWLRIMLWWVVLLAIVIEACALWYIFGLSPRRALLSSTLINVGTAVLGLFLYPFVVITAYEVLQPHIVSVFGASELVGTIGLSVVAAVVDTPIELALLVLLSTVLGYGLKIGWKAALLFFIANILSASVLLVALQTDPGTGKVDRETRHIIEQQLESEKALFETVFQELPAHTDPEGHVDEVWRTELADKAGQLKFFQLEAAVTGAWGMRKVSIFLKEGLENVERHSVSYGETQKDGDLHITTATMNKMSADDQQIVETIEVLIFDVYRYTEDGNGYQVTATLILSQQ